MQPDTMAIPVGIAERVSLRTLLLPGLGVVLALCRDLHITGKQPENS